MLNRMRLIFTGLFVSLALIACSDESDNAVTDNTETQTTAPATVETTPDAAAETTLEASDNGIESGMSRDSLIEVYGEPDIAQKSTLDQMKIEVLEWHKDDALITAQVVDGKVTYGRIVPISE